MNRCDAIEIDFTEQIKQLQADKEAGYPPKCNPGYKVSEDGKKCIKTEEKVAKENHARRRVGTTNLTLGDGLCPNCGCNPCQCGS